MKHHLFVLIETPILRETYTVWECNYTAPEPYMEPYPDLAEIKNDDGLKLAELPPHELKPYLLNKLGFIERFSSIQQPDEHGRIVDIPIGQSSLVEMVLAQTGIISFWFYDQRGLPVRQMVYAFQTADD